MLGWGLGKAWLPSRWTLTVWAGIIWGSPLVASEAGEPLYRRDVMAVLSKAGCNTGACHGNFRGKGGFRLSLRGQDPDADYDRIAGELAGRRINRLEPAKSLLLQKPTAQVAHQGGARFAIDSPEYQILHDWVASGAPLGSPADPQLVDLQVTPRSAIIFAPGNELSLRVVATFADGTQQDVTRWAVYEPSTVTVEVTVDGVVRRREMGEVTVAVRYLSKQVPVSLTFAPDRSSFVWQAAEPDDNYIDRRIQEKLARLQIEASPVCSDDTFLRRVSLDLGGLLPTADEAREFVADRSPQKRRRLVDRLLNRPEFAELWALKWSDMLRNEEKVLDPQGVQVFYDWMRGAIARNMPLDQFVRELLTARGSTYQQPAANFYRALRSPTERGEAVARLFLGHRLQCAQCHNHPFDRWTQNDYFAWAALFARVDYEIVSNERRDKLDKNEFNGEQIVVWKGEGEVHHPDTGQLVSPRLLGLPESVAADSEPLSTLAAWLTSGDNRQFARAQANWIWAQFMGRGIVDPVDDFRATNPPTHPELLDQLADDLVEHGFDVRYLIGQIVASQAYQRSYLPNDTNADDETNYSRAPVRRLTAEQLLDAQAQVMGVPVEFRGYPLGMRAGQLAGVHKVRSRNERPSEGDRFLFAFGKPERLLACDCERSAVTTLNQALLLTSGGVLDSLLNNQQNVLYKSVRQEIPLADIVDQLYWSALTRAPTESERAAARELIRNAPPAESMAVLQDLAWSLLNAKEFVFQR